MIDTKKQKEIYSKGVFYQLYGEKTRKDYKAHSFWLKL